MTLERLIRLSGLISVAAAVLIIISQLIGFFAIDPDNLMESIKTTPVWIFQILKLFSFVLLLLGLVGLYARQSVEAGALGLIGFLVAFWGTTMLAGDWWYEGLAVPWLADVAPQVLEESPSGSLLAGGLTGLALFSLGWVLFGIASFRARVFPRWAAGVVILGGAQGIQAGYPPFQIVLGLGVGLMGYWLYTRGSVPQGVPRAATEEARPPQPI
jgi:hypothetical protein